MIILSYLTSSILNSSSKSTGYFFRKRGSNFLTFVCNLNLYLNFRAVITLIPFGTLSVDHQGSLGRTSQLSFPKPILLDTGEMSWPYDWHPRIIDTQVLQLGQFIIAGLPGWVHHHVWKKNEENGDGVIDERFKCHILFRIPLQLEDIS